MWPFSKKKVEEKPVEQEPWYIVNKNYYREYGDLYNSKPDIIAWKGFYGSGPAYYNGIPVSCFEEFTRVLCIHELIIDRLGIADPFMHGRANMFSFERNNIVNDALDKLKKFKAEHELDELETNVIDNMIKQFRHEND